MFNIRVGYIGPVAFLFIGGKGIPIADIQEIAYYRDPPDAHVTFHLKGGDAVRFGEPYESAGLIIDWLESRPFTLAPAIESDGG